MRDDFDAVRAAVCAEVAKLLREERIRQGLSMSELAERAGLSQPMVSYVERGMRNPTLDTLLRLSAVLQVPLWEIVRRAEASGQSGTGRQ